MSDCTNYTIHAKSGSLCQSREITLIFKELKLVSPHRLFGIGHLSICITVPPWVGDSEDIDRAVSLG